MDLLLENLIDTNIARVCPCSALQPYPHVWGQKRLEGSPSVLGLTA